MIFVCLIILGLIDATEEASTEKQLLISFNENPNINDYHSLELLINSDFNSDIETHKSMYAFCLFNDNLNCANTHLNKAISLDKNSKDLRELSNKLKEYAESISRAKKTFDRELYDEAEREYENIISTYPNSALSYYELGVVHLDQSNYKKAVSSFNKAIKLNPYKETYKNAVISVAQRIAKEADEAARRQDFNTAIPKYITAIEYYPQFTEALFNLSKTYYLELDDFDNAIKYLKQNLEINENQPQSLKMLADIYKKDRNASEAIKYYKKAIAAKSDYFQAYYSLGALYRMTGKLDMAKKNLESAIDIRNDYYRAHEALGVVNHDLNNYSEALDNFSTTIKLLEKKPRKKRSYTSFYLSSKIYCCMKEFDLAKQFAKGALDIKRNCAPAFLYLGIAEKNLNNMPAALDAFNSAKLDKDWRESADFELRNYEKDTSANLHCEN